MPIFKRVIAVFCLLATVTMTPPGILHAKEPVKTNLDVIKELTTEVSEELISGFPADVAGREIRLAPTVGDERYEFIADVLMRTLTVNGYRAYTPVVQNPGDTLGGVQFTARHDGELRLEYEAIEFDLRYPKVYRSFLIGGKKVKRRADVRLLLRLVDPVDGLVVSVSEAARSSDDQFPHSWIEEVEAGTYSFNKPPHSSRKWGTIIEPLAVSAIVVGLIYLFFSNQSD